MCLTSCFEVWRTRLRRCAYSFRTALHTLPYSIVQERKSRLRPTGRVVIDPSPPSDDPSTGKFYPQAP